MFSPVFPGNVTRPKPNTLGGWSPVSLSGCQLWLPAKEGARSDGARQYTAANTEFHSIADNASLSTGDIDFMIGGWIYLDSYGSPSDGRIMSIRDYPCLSES